MGYDNIHNITHKVQNHELIDSNGKERQVRGTTYDWSYAYNPSGADSVRPHAPYHIGTRTFSYDANGNQTGWESDINGTRRRIDWDDENRIQKIGDPSNTLEFAYDDSGERVVKRGQHGMTVYVNQYFTVRNLALASKHIFAGTTRIATKVEPGEPVGYKAEPLPTDGTGTLTTSGTTSTISGGGTTTATEEPGLVDKALDFLGLGTWKKEGGHTGQGLEHRSERANEVAQNTVKNPNLTGHRPEKGRLSDKPGNNAGGNGNSGHGNNGGGNPDKGNNGNGGGSTVHGINGGGKKAPYDYGGTFLYFYHPDHLGSTAHVTDADAELYEHIQYFPFGETWVEEAANTIQRVPYRYTSKELDEETGLYYYGARYYDPRTSVWQSADPILGQYLPKTPIKKEDFPQLVPPTRHAFTHFNLPGMGGIFEPKNLNVYAYSHQNPIRYTDPDGNETTDDMMSVVKENLGVIRNELAGLDLYSRADRAKLATIAAAAGRYDSFDSAAAVIRMNPVEASLVQTELEIGLRDASVQKFLPELAEATRSAALDINGGLYTTTPALKALGGAAELTGSLLTLGSTEVAGGAMTVNGFKSLGDLAKRVNGVSPDAAKNLIRHGVGYYARRCGNGLNCGN